MSVAGFDAQGHPVLLVNQFGTFTTPPPPGYQPPPPELILLPAMNQAARLASGTADAPRSAGGVSGDSKGIWTSRPGQLWIYRPGRLRKVADIPQSLFPLPTPPPGAPAKDVPAGASGPYLQVAGACA